MRAATIYRVLVAAQTIALALVALERVASHRPRAVPGFSPFAIASIALVIIAILARRNILATWTCLQLAGAVALIGYFATGELLCFIASIIALTVMHVFSPNRS
ncbi:MAG TPA: hypothetical protein VJ901_15465 [Thermoanaerobaculia bacterium]|nr:hypothetical protein [Thermoanaerobaculia bacterium]